VQKLGPSLACARFKHEYDQRGRMRFNSHRSHGEPPVREALSREYERICRTYPGAYCDSTLRREDLQCNVCHVPLPLIHLCAGMVEFTSQTLLSFGWTSTHNPPTPMGRPNSTSRDVIIQLSNWM
jgi:hypothetical protein